MKSATGKITRTWSNQSWLVKNREIIIEMEARRGDVYTFIAYGASGAALFNFVRVDGKEYTIDYIDPPPGDEYTGIIVSVNLASIP